MKEFQKLVQQQFLLMCATGKLFKSNITGQQVWDLYLKTMPDTKFRDPSSTQYNCNNCKNFFRRYGNILAINDKNEIMSIFDVSIEGEYHDVAIILSEKLKSSSIQDVFFETFDELNTLPYEACKKTNSIFRLGMAFNHKKYTQAEVDVYKVVNTTDVYTFNHLHLDIPVQFVDMSGKSVENLMGSFRDAKNVFQKAMELIPLDTLLLVKDLINQGSLLDGTTHLHKIETFIPLKEAYDKLASDVRDNWCWTNSYKLPIAKFKNELIGTLCSDLAEGKELNEACKAWNYRVDPANYMKVTAPITQKQIEEAKKFVTDNGYEESFSRRFATIDDIKASEILHLNSGDGKIKAVSIFDDVKSTSTRHKKSEFDKIEEIPIEKFMQDILPNCTSIEAFLTNSQEGNMMSLTTSNVKESRPIFKWDNNYSWTFNGNLAGKSMIKTAVKERGGKVEAPIRVSIHFPNTTSDYDLHCTEPNRVEIYYGNRRTKQLSSGMLDLDAQGADGHFPPDKRVENLTYSDVSKMKDGDYKLFVHNYSGSNIKTAFTAEVEIFGELTSLNVKTNKNTNAQIGILKVVKGNVEFIPNLTDCEILESQTISKEIYTLETNQFHKINLVCLSPNHWNENNIGNKHYLFFLENAKSPISIRSFHNENLIPELLEHKRVLEVLGNTAMIPSTEKQLSGLGFNSTVRDELILKLSGTHKRIVKIKF